MSSAPSSSTVVSRCAEKIKAALQTEQVLVRPGGEDPNGSHIAIEAVSALFEGKTTVQRQRLIYKAIWDEMADGGAVHAVDSIVAKAPSEVAKAK